MNLPLPLSSIFSKINENWPETWKAAKIIFPHFAVVRKAYWDNATIEAALIGSRFQNGQFIELKVTSAKN